MNDNAKTGPTTPSTQRKQAIRSLANTPTNNNPTTQQTNNPATQQTSKPTTTNKPTNQQTNKPTPMPHVCHPQQTSKPTN